MEGEYDKIKDEVEISNSIHNDTNIKTSNSETTKINQGANENNSGIFHGLDENK